MSVSELNHFDELVSRYLDASLGAEEEHELLQYLADEDLASRFFEMTKLNAEIGGLMAGSMPDEAMINLVWSDLVGRENSVPVETAAATPVAVRAKSKKYTSLLLALAAMVVGLLAISALFYFRTAAPIAGGEMASVSGEVSFVSPSGQVQLADGQSLKGEGTVKTVGSDSRATIELKDGSRIELMGETSLAVGFFAGKRRLTLDRGVVRSTVARQPEGAPLVFNTAETVITVRGTELVIVAEKDQTYLLVAKGEVALRRSSGGPEVLIEAGYYGHVEKTGAFRPWPIARLPKEFRDLAYPSK